MSGRSSRSTLMQTKLLVHQRRHGGILEGLALHHVAPVAGRVADRDEQRPVQLARALQRLLAPRIPVDRVVGMLEQVRRGLSGKAIGHPGEATWAPEAQYARGGATSGSRLLETQGEDLAGNREPVTATGAPEAIGPYVHAVAASGLLFCSGQIPLDPRTGDLVGATAADQAGRCLENLAAVCQAAGATLGDAVKVTIYMTDMSAFASVNEVYGSFFESSPPARVAVGVAALPRGAQVEMDAVVAFLAESASMTGRPSRRPTTSAAPRRPVPGRQGDPAAELADADRAGGEDGALKAENLQRTGSFKLRGALAKLASLGSACEDGVVVRQRRQPRPGGRLRGPPARRALQRVHARGGPDRQGRGDGSARRAGAAGGRDRRRVADAAEEWARRRRARVRAPVRRSRVVAGQGGARPRAAGAGPRICAGSSCPVGGGGLTAGWRSR